MSTRTTHPSKGLAAFDALIMDPEITDSGTNPADEMHRIHIALHRLEEISGSSVVEVLETLSSRVAQVIGTSVSPALSTEQDSVLRRAGSVVEAMPPIVERATTLTTLLYRRLVADSLTTSEAAEVLSVGASRIRQRVTDRTLFTIRAQKGTRFPIFQFVEGGELPGWVVVAPHFPHDAHAVAVANFLHTPHVDLDVGGESVSPYVWLAEGREPERVAELVDASYRLP